MAGQAKLARRPRAQIRRALLEADAALGSSVLLVTADSPIEVLDISVRARNALHRLGCTTLGEVCALNLKQGHRQLGTKSKLELLEALKKYGIRHPAIDAAPSSDVTGVARGLERIELRLTKTLRDIARDINMLQEKLSKLGGSL